MTLSRNPVALLPPPVSLLPTAPAVRELVGESRCMEQLRERIRRVADSDRPLLVVGPTGAGKDQVVNAVHASGPNPHAPLTDLNCGAIPDSLMESQLFGHERGAFTGAERRCAGHLEAVGAGTLFLDEVAELPVALQAKLLRVLETRRFRPVGGAVDKRFEGRVVAATHANLEERVSRGLFREDLYHRLNVLVVRVPPLAEHLEDIPALLAHFCRGQPRSLRFTPGAHAALMAMPWPGNVRQLRTLVDRLIVFADEELISESCVAAVSGTDASSPCQQLRNAARQVLALPLADKLRAMEEALVQEALAVARGNKSEAARLLGVHRKVVTRRLEPDPAETLVAEDG